MAAATYVQGQARMLGIQMTVQGTTADVINYAIFSSRDFDAAVLGWNVGRYPGYLCEWFGATKPFQYQPSRVTSLCSELEATSDLEAAQAKMHEIESALAQDVPIIPLYSGVIREPYRNVAYPFPSVLGGLRGVYGAPALALPGSP
jgi:ABC-type transport system substrate-binding protein